MDFVIAATAGVGAGIFTNPLEVLKTKMQLQGELQAKGHHAVHYKNVMHATYVIAKNDGVLALQKGLVPALWVQFLMNGIRLGTYQWAANNNLISDKNGKLIISKSIAVSAIGAVLGQIICSPVFLVKTHLQAQSTAAIAVGHQYNHAGMWSALINIYHEHGVKGLYRGVAASIPRAAVGSVSQLLSFDYSRQQLLKYNFFENKKLLTAFLASMVGGLSISVAMTPFELVMTRLYNQPTGANGKGLLYSNYYDCVSKIYKTEGLFAFYKGVGPMYLRLGPHTVLSLVFWDRLNECYVDFTKRKNKVIN